MLTAPEACLRFERAITANQEQRLRFKSKPEMFMKSEMELDQAIQQLAVLGTDGGLYPTFVEIGCVPSLLSVLLHENTDIALDVIELLVDLTEPSIFADQPNAAVLLDAIVRTSSGGRQPWRKSTDHCVVRTRGAAVPRGESKAPRPAQGGGRQGHLPHAHSGGERLRGPA